MIKQMLSVSSRLSSLQRYSQTRLVNPESVLEHQGMVGLAAYFIASELIERGEGLDLSKVLRCAIIHDIDEVGTGDVPRPTKYATDEMFNALNGLSKIVVKDIQRNMGVSFLYNDWRYAKAGKEGMVVGLCDGLSVLMKVWQEAVLFGNRTIIDHAGAVRSMLSPKIESLRENVHSVQAKFFIDDLWSDAQTICDEIESLKYKGEY